MAGPQQRVIIAAAGCESEIKLYLMVIYAAFHVILQIGTASLLLDYNAVLSHNNNILYCYHCLVDTIKTANDFILFYLNSRLVCGLCRIKILLLHLWPKTRM